jgi:SAM-dependent methyltransferase
MTWWYAVVESRHELQNPTSADKIRLLGERLGLGPESRVLDVAAGRGGPALVLAQEFGCRITCVERAPEFAGAAARRVEAAGLAALVDVIQADARTFAPERGAYDAALCLGATFVWDGVSGTVAALAPAVRPGGFVVLGEPYWRVWPLPDGFEVAADEDFVTLARTVERIERTGLAVVSSIASSEDDWDRYESLRWLTLDAWLRANPGDPQAEEFRARGGRCRDRYLRWTRALLGWSIFVART